MRAILVSYAELGINSTNHVLGFARGLAGRGWNVSVAVLRALRFQDGFRFLSIGPDGTSVEQAPREVSPAEIVHVWTTRGAIWHFLDVHRGLVAGRLVVHLEDDEAEIVKAFSRGRRMDSSWWEPDGMERRGLGHLAHPILGRCLIGCADALTVLSPELLKESPAGVPAVRVMPPLEPRWLTPKATPVRARTDEATIVYSGGVHPAVANDFHALCAAVGLLVGQGRSVRLVRSGPPALPSALIAEGARLSRQFEDVGFLAEDDLEQLLRGAQVLVQPGSATDFNRRRLPAKLVPYLASGTPVVMPECYGWLGIRHREHAWMYDDGSPEAIAAGIAAVLDEPDLGYAMANRAAAWARDAFSPENCATELERLYESALSRPPELAWDRLIRPRVQLPAWLAVHPERASRVAPETLRRFSVAASQKRAAPEMNSLVTAPLVSVVVPNFNHRRFLPERMRSIFAQSYRNLEVIFLDDGSTDGSLEWLRSQSSPFPLRVIANETNGGRVFRQWQRGVEEARGDFVWIAESDDSCDSDLVERLVAAAAWSSCIGVAYAQSKLIDESGSEIGNCSADTDEIDARRWKADYLNRGADEVARYLVLRNTIPNASACLFRRTALLKADLASIDLRVSGDWMAYVRLLREFDIAFVAEPLNRYRIHAQTARARARRAGYLQEEMYLVQAYICRNFDVPDDRREAAADLAARQLWHTLQGERGLPTTFFEDLGLAAKAEPLDGRLPERLAEIAAGPADGVMVLDGARTPSGAPLPALSTWRWQPAVMPLAGGRVALRAGRRGLVSVRNARIRNRATGETVWTGTGPEALGQLQTSGGAFRLRSSGRLDVLLTSTDAVVHFPIPGVSASLATLELECELRRGGAPDALDAPTGSGKTVLLIVPHLELGGADRYNLDLIQQLSSRFDWNVTVVTTRRAADRWEREFLRQTSDVFCLHRFLTLQEYPEFLRTLIHLRKPEAVLVSHSLFGYGLAPWMRRAFPALPILDLVHIVTGDWKRGGYPRMSVENRDVLDRTLCTSEHVRNWLVGEGLEPSRADVCYTNIDIRTWRRDEHARESARRQWGLPESQQVIVFSGRLCDQKQPQLLPDIACGLLERGNDFVLLVVGDGPDRAWLETELGAELPFNTRMVGALPPDAMRRLYAAADLLLLPSKNEGIALTLFEALSMEVVPVATDVGGQSELVTPECGILVPFSSTSAEALVAAADRLLKTPELRAAMASAGRRRVEAHFRLEQMGDCVNSALEKAIEDRSRSLSADLPATDEQELHRLATTAIRIAAEEREESTDWETRLKAGKRFPRAASLAAERLRRLPVLGRVAREIENRFGDRIGRWIMRFV